MTVFCFGSINLDHFYILHHLPVPGETLAATSYRVETGGKGANQSIAAARAGAQVVHIGAVGPDGGSAVASLRRANVDVAHIRDSAQATGHAIIMVDAKGENAIVVHPGANADQRPDAIMAGLEAAQIGDILLLQNETTLQPQIAEAAMGLGMEVIYSAAPFDLDAVQAVLPFTNMLLLNEVEARQLQDATGSTLEDLPVEAVIITKGSAGAQWHARATPEIVVPALPVEVVDTTGAGDCFAGALAAALDCDMAPAEAMRFASAAAALQVSRHGTASAMPTLAEITAKLAEKLQPAP